MDSSTAPCLSSFLSVLGRSILTVMLAVTGSACGSLSNGPGNQSLSVALGTELGADRITWMAHHRAGDPTFRDVSFAGDRVDGFTMHLGAGGVAEEVARTEAVKEIPADARLVFQRPKYAGTTDPDDQCDLLQYQSTLLARVIPDDPTGVILIHLGRLTDNGLEPYDPNHVTTIVILATGTLNDAPGEC